MILNKFNKFKNSLFFKTLSALKNYDESNKFDNLNRNIKEFKLKNKKKNYSLEERRKYNENKY